MFLGTVRDNLLIAVPAADDAALWAALAAVGADGWVREHPDGLDTELGTGGRRTDGSRAQQLALARGAGRPAHPHPRRGDRPARSDDRAPHRACARRRAGGAHGDRHRAPVAHRARRGPGRRDGGRTSPQLGTDDELVAAEGAYAALWRTWGWGLMRGRAGTRTGPSGSGEALSRVRARPASGVRARARSGLVRPLWRGAAGPSHLAPPRTGHAPANSPHAEHEHPDNGRIPAKFLTRSYTSESPATLPTAPSAPTAPSPRRGRGTPGNWFRDHTVLPVVLPGRVPTPTGSPLAARAVATQKESVC